jgi:N-acetylneuraminic acid mutarotase
MVRRALVVIACGLAASACASHAQAPQGREILQWQRLPDLPQPISGQFVGVSNGALIVAGGSYFPVPLFEGGQKRWVATVFVLQPETKEWQGGFALARPLAYGASVTTDDGVICIGGCDAERCYAEVFRLRWVNGRVEQTPLPDLPRPCAMTSAALVGSSVYVAGGQDSPGATAALRSFWKLELQEPQLGWQELAPWPGPARILPVPAGQGGAFYLASGAELFAGPDGKAARRYLTDAYRFRPKGGWERIADLLRAVVAAPAVAYGRSRILVFGGDDGANAERILELKENHPGFSRAVLAYDTRAKAWAQMGTLPASLVTTTAVRWGDGVVIAGGEDRPGHRSPNVYRLQFAGGQQHVGP